MNTWESLRTLLISDDDYSLEKLQAALHRAGFRTLVAMDGVSGLRLAGAEHPDLIIIDDLLLEPGGVQVCEMLNASPNCSDIPRILLVSSRPAPTDPTLPADLLIPKPAASDYLVGQIKRLLRIEKKEVPRKPIGPVILLIDRQGAELRSLTETLGEADYRVFGTDDPETGLLMVDQLWPALVMADIEFPGGRGLEVVKMLYRNYPQMTVIIIANSDQQEPAPAILNDGVDGILVRPIALWQVAPLVERCLEAARMKELVGHLRERLRESHSRLAEQQQALSGQNLELERVNERLRGIDLIRENLANMIVHDLKNPLGVLLGTIELVKMEADRSLRSEYRDILATGKAAGQHMLTLMNSILELDRLEEGKMPLDLEPLVFKDVLRLSLSQAHPLFKAKDLRLEEHIPEGLPYVRADQVLLERIIDNLLSNAIKYSPNRGTITITAEVKDGEVLVRVQDNGPGIPVALQEKIFEKFIQVEIRRVGERAGAGLGLPFCKLATESLGGRIWVESEEKKGSTFCFTLPIWKEAGTGE